MKIKELFLKRCAAFGVGLAVVCFTARIAGFHCRAAVKIGLTVLQKQ